MLIDLEPYAERRGDDASAVAARLRDAASRVPGIALFVSPVQDLTVDDRAGKAQYQYVVESPDPDVLARVVPELVERLRALPELTSVSDDAQTGALGAFVEVDRDRAAELGITMASVDESLYGAFGQRFVSTIFTQTSQYRVVLEMHPDQAEGLGALDALHVTSERGGQVPLRALARVVEKPAPLVVHRERQFPATTIAFDLAPHVSLGEAVSAVEAETRALGLPDGVQARFRGAALAFRAAAQNELFLILAALVTMYIVLGILYESFVHPLTILSTLPSAGVGALLALMITRTELTVIAIIGIILLIGIVQKNAILIVDFALEASNEHGQSPLEAIRTACVIRFRPILMTTLAALFSAIPLVLGSGPGSELRRPLGITMIGGLLLSQLLTLFTTPVVYLAIDRLARPAAPPLRACARGHRRGGRVSLLALFVRRPVATTLLLVAIALPGILAFLKLPISSLPQVDFPSIGVSAGLPGANAEAIAATVATPLERTLGRIAGITEMTSTSSQGSARVNLQFDLDKNVDSAAREVQAAINAARALLPASLPSNPIYRKVNAASSPILAIALTSPIHTQEQLYDVAFTILGQKIAQVRGVGQVNVNGSALRSVRVEVDPTLLNHHGVSLEQIRRALAAANVNAPKGFVQSGEHRFQLDANDRAEKAADYRELIVAFAHGAPVRLAQLASVRDSVQEWRNAGSSGGKPAVMLSVMNQPGANVVETVDAVRALLPGLSHLIPSAIDVEVVIDRSTTIRGPCARSSTRCSYRSRSWCS